MILKNLPVVVGISGSGSIAALVKQKKDKELETHAHVIIFAADS
jgi:hypothetical protein